MYASKLAPVISKLEKASLFCKVMYITLLIGYGISFSETLHRGLSIIPRNLFPPNFWLWTVVTYFIIEKNLLILILDLISVHLCGSVLEPLWTPIELVKYLLIVNCCVAVVTTFEIFILYFFVADTELLFSITVHGLSGFVGALLVAVKQVLPDSTLIQTPAGRLKNGHLPGLVLIGVAVLTLFGAMKAIVPAMYVNGMFFGWIFLRYYQSHQNGTQGDMSEHFSFASFFPSALQPPVETLSGFLYRTLVRVKICKPAIRHFDVSQLQSVTVSIPGSEPQDVERRRQKALRDLESRLSRAKETNMPAWPSMDPSTQPESPGPVPHGTPVPVPAVVSDTTQQSEPPEEPAESGSQPKLVLNTSGSEFEDSEGPSPK